MPFAGLIRVGNERAKRPRLAQDESNGLGVGEPAGHPPDGLSDSIVLEVALTAPLASLLSVCRLPA